MALLVLLAKYGCLRPAQYTRFKFSIQHFRNQKNDPHIIEEGNKMTIFVIQTAKIRQHSENAPF